MVLFIKSFVLTLLHDKLYYLQEVVAAKLLITHFRKDMKNQVQIAGRGR